MAAKNYPNGSVCIVHIQKKRPQAVKRSIVGFDSDNEPLPGDYTRLFL